LRVISLPSNINTTVWYVNSNTRHNFSPWYKINGSY
jgi:hypothetical protein